MACNAQMTAKGFVRKKAKYRVAFSACPALWAPGSFAGEAYRLLKKEGLASIDHDLRGASRRDWALSRCQQRPEASRYKCQQMRRKLKALGVKTVKELAVITERTKTAWARELRNRKRASYRIGK